MALFRASSSRLDHFLLLGRPHFHVRSHSVTLVHCKAPLQKPWKLQGPLHALSIPGRFSCCVSNGAAPSLILLLSLRVFSPQRQQHLDFSSHELPRHLQGCLKIGSPSRFLSVYFFSYFLTSIIINDAIIRAEPCHTTSLSRRQSRMALIELPLGIR